MKSIHPYILIASSPDICGIFEVPRHPEMFEMSWHLEMSWYLSSWRDAQSWRDARSHNSRPAMIITF